jgi:hypothetical protein
VLLPVKHPFVNRPAHYVNRRNKEGIITFGNYNAAQLNQIEYLDLTQHSSPPYAYLSPPNHAL